jgi:hypothetical protein
MYPNEKRGRGDKSGLPANPYFFSSGFAASAAASFFSFLSSLCPLTALAATTLPNSPIQYSLLAQLYNKTLLVS